MTAEIWGDSSKIRFRVQWVGVFIDLSLALLLMRVLDTTIRYVDHASGNSEPFTILCTLPTPLLNTYYV